MTILSTLSSLKALPIPKPSIGTLLMVGRTAAMANPITAVAATAITAAVVLKTASNHSSTVNNLGNNVKADVSGAVNTIGKGVTVVGHSVSSGLKNMMMPIIIVGAIVVVIMIIKK